MTFRPPFGIWTTAKSFYEGEAPILTSTSSRTAAAKLAREAISAGTVGTRVFIAASNLKAQSSWEQWTPMGFMTAKTYEPCSDKQREKYVRARVRNLSAAEPVAPEANSGAVPLTPVEEPEFDQKVFTLTLEPKVVEVLRDAFILLSQGHIVNVQAPSQLLQEQAPAPE